MNEFKDWFEMNIPVKKMWKHCEEDLEIYKIAKEAWDYQQQKLNSAIEVIEFYGDKDNWHCERYGEYKYFEMFFRDWEKDWLGEYYAGKKARNWLKENNE